MARVLVVDDEPDVRRLVRLILEADGHDVVEAIDGPKGLQALVDRTLDAVVLDVMMPGLSGVDVLESLHGAVAVLVLTANPDEQVHARCLAAGARRVLTKPFGGLELQNAVRALVA